MERDIDRVLLSQDQIRERIRSLGKEIVSAYPDFNAGLTFLPVLAGAFIFTADLIRELPLKMKIAMVQLSSYPGTATTAQTLKTIMDITGDIKGRHVIIVDDILDSGNTIRYVKQLVEQHEPASVRAAVLLRKPTKAPVDVHVDFIGFDVEDEFVVGYGLDYDDHYRNLPFIGVLRPEVTT